MLPTSLAPRKRQLLAYSSIGVVCVIVYVMILRQMCTPTGRQEVGLQKRDASALGGAAGKANNCSCPIPPNTASSNGASGGEASSSLEDPEAASDEQQPPDEDEDETETVLHFEANQQRQQKELKTCIPVDSASTSGDGMQHIALGLDAKASASSDALRAVPVRHPTTRLDAKEPDVVLFHPEKHPSSRRTGVKIIMGIPTVRRPAAIYVTETLDSLVERVAPSELDRMVFVLFLADKDPALLEELFDTVYKKYSAHFASGLIETVVAKENAYKPWPQPLRRTFGDPEDRVKWRSKENYDYALLMEYCKGRAEFYMQLEDDILAARNYYQGILATVDRAKNFQPPWSMLEFTRLGSYAKLFRDTELLEIAALLRYFYLEQPTDWMMFNFVAIKMQNNRIFSTHALFQHIGKQSSLEGKRQDLVDHTFREDGDPGGIDGAPGDEVWSDRSGWTPNPPAEVVTNIVHRNHYTPQGFYDNKRPMLGWLRRGHWIEIWFAKPVVIRKFILRSGHPTRPTDTLNGAEIQALYVDKKDFASITSGSVVIETTSFSATTPVSVLKIAINADHHYQTCFEQIVIEAAK